MNSQNEGYKKFFIKTLGCKVNQYESQAMRELLVRSGFRECLAKDIADIYVLNTCTVTNQADRESRYWLSLFHRTNPKAKIVVTGCYVEHDSDKLSFLPGISHILKNSEKNRIGEILSSETTKYSRLSIAPLKITDFKDRTKAFVKIQDGCENFCSYCKVPLVRGPLKSKALRDILEEVTILVEKGFREIVLTGICLGAWGKDLESYSIANALGLKGLTLVDVLEEIVRIKGDFRIRLSSIEPRYLTDELIDFVSREKRICKHFHIPLQSGDDEILKKMDRPYTTKDYRTLLDKVKDKVKGAAITTDILIGFPGEAEANFKNTLQFIKEVQPMRTHIFTFSKRPGTVAHDMEGGVGRDVLKRRYYELEVAALESSYLYRSRFLGESLDILVESKRDRRSGLLTGYSDNYIKVLFEGPDTLMNKIVSVKIEDLNLSYTLAAYDSN